MFDFDYTTNDHIGRRVEIRDYTFAQCHTTIYGDGSRSSVTSLWW